MATIHIESCFIEAWTKNTDEHPTWGMKTAEPHSRKNDAGKYETVGRTFRTVKVSRSSGIDLTPFKKGDRVQVWGKEVTESREHEGKKFYDLVLWADRVEPVGARDGAAPASEPLAASVPEAPTGDMWNTPGAYSDETPF